MKVLDINDNKPIFSQNNYETSIGQKTRKGTSVLTVYSEDADSTQNAQLTYTLLADTRSSKEHQEDVDYFELVSPNSGEIKLARSIPGDKKKFVFTVDANDSGLPEPLSGQAQVVINVHSKLQNAPQWQSSEQCPQTVTVKEDLPKNTLLLKCFALSGDGISPISYSLMNGAKPDTNGKQTFREFKDKVDGIDYVMVRNMEALDFERIQNYTLILTATDMHSGLTADKKFFALVQDCNDAIPVFTLDKFVGSIDENIQPDEFLER